MQRSTYTLFGDRMCNSVKLPIYSMLVIFYIIECFVMMTNTLRKSYISLLFMIRVKIVLYIYSLT